jgi:hypothetical protein
MIESDSDKNDQGAIISSISQFLAQYTVVIGRPGSPQPVPLQQLASPEIPSGTSPESLLALAVSPVALRVDPLPRLPPPGFGLGVAVALVDAARLLARRRQASGFAVLPTVRMNTHISGNFHGKQHPPCEPA